MTVAPRRLGHHRLNRRPSWMRVSKKAVDDRGKINKPRVLADRTLRDPPGDTPRSDKIDVLSPAHTSSVPETGVEMAVCRREVVGSSQLGAGERDTANAISPSFWVATKRYRSENTG